MCSGAPGAGRADLWIEGPAGCGKSLFVNSVLAKLFGSYYQRGGHKLYNPQRGDRLGVDQANTALCHYELSSGPFREADIKALASPSRRLQVRDLYARHTHAVEDKRVFVITSTRAATDEDTVDMGNTSLHEQVLLLRASGEFAMGLHGRTEQERAEYFSKLMDAADDDACYTLFRCCMRLDLAGKHG